MSNLTLIDGALYAARVTLAMERPPAKKLVRISQSLGEAAELLGQTLRAEIAENPAARAHHTRMETETLHHLKLLVDLTIALAALVKADGIVAAYHLPCNVGTALSIVHERARNVAGLAGWHWQARTTETALAGVRETRVGQELAAALAPEGE